MLFIGKNKVFEILRKSMNIHYINGSNIYYIIDLLRNKECKSNEFSFETFFNIVSNISFLDYSKDNYSKLNKQIEKRIPLRKEAIIDDAVCLKNTFDLAKGGIDLLDNNDFGPIVNYMHEYKPNPYSRYAKRCFPSLGGINVIRILLVNKNDLLLICYFHRYQWRYKNSWSYCESLIDLGHALGFVKSLGYTTSTIKSTPFLSFIKITFNSNKKYDWRILKYQG